MFHFYRNPLSFCRNSGSFRSSLSSPVLTTFLRPGEGSYSGQIVNQPLLWPSVREPSLFLGSGGVSHVYHMTAPPPRATRRLFICGIRTGAGGVWLSRRLLEFCVQQHTHTHSHSPPMSPPTNIKSRTTIQLVSGTLSSFKSEGLTHSHKAWRLVALSGCELLQRLPRGSLVSFSFPLISGLGGSRHSDAVR